MGAGNLHEEWTLFSAKGGIWREGWAAQPFIAQETALEANHGVLFLEIHGTIIRLLCISLASAGDFSTILRPWHTLSVITLACLLQGLELDKGMVSI